MIRTLHEVAPRCSFVHDVAEGGLAIALAEAALAAGIGAELDLDDDALTLFGEGGGRAILASSEELPFARIGSVGGSTLLGVPDRGPAARLGGDLVTVEMNPDRFDRSFPTAQRAEPVRPDGGTAKAAP